MTQPSYNSKDRLSIFSRLIVTIVCLIAYEILKIVVYACVAFQYIYLLIAGRSSEPLRIFCNRLSMYIYRILRYATLNENKRPFPFSSLPTDQETEKSVNKISFP